jgi:hypothetical protein
MRLSPKRKPKADDVRRVALAAIAGAVEEARQQDRNRKSGVTGMRALAAGAALYTAGWAAFGNRRQLLDRVGSMVPGLNGAPVDTDEELVDDDEDLPPEVDEDEDLEPEDEDLEEPEDLDDDER